MSQRLRQTVAVTQLVTVTLDVWRWTKRAAQPINERRYHENTLSSNSSSGHLRIHRRVGTIAIQEI